MGNKLMNIGITLLFGVILSFLINYNKYLYNEKKQQLDLFSDSNLLDINGNVNLSEIKEERDNLKNEVNDLFLDYGISVNEYEDDINKIKEENNELLLKVQNLNKEIDSLNSKKDTLASQYTVLNNNYQLVLKKKEEEIRRNTVLINGVPTINQYPNYPTGCESVALTILLRYYGVNVSADNIISTLKKGDAPYYENNVRYGGNPEIEFIGSPYSYDSYGVYNNPIADVANQFKAGATVRTGMPFSEVLNLVKNNVPVMVWTSMNLAMPYITNSWIYKPTGETISWKSQEHAVILIGYNDENVIISDPLRGSVRYQSRSVFESRYNYYGKRAVYY